MVLLHGTKQGGKNKPNAFYHKQFNWSEVFQSPKMQTYKYNGYAAYENVKSTQNSL
jgi:hypothetical protein